MKTYFQNTYHFENIENIFLYIISIFWNYFILCIAFLKKNAINNDISHKIKCILDLTRSSQSKLYRNARNAIEDTGSGEWRRMGRHHDPASAIEREAVLS